ncbi:MAG TPA: MFS transporter [Kofleriaceae bacterium]|nr:MFS transporter [Kofleriaceae bacterium]
MNARGRAVSAADVRFLAGVALLFLVFGMETTGVAAALPSITADLRPASLYGWVPAGFLLAEVIATPLAARLVDSAGARTVAIASVGMLMVGSLGAATSTSMVALVISSALQGLGHSGAYMAVVVAISARFTGVAGLARAQGFALALFGVGQLLGPAITEVALRASSWRALYWLEIPLAAIALLLVLGAMRGVRAAEARRMDVAALVVLSALGAVLCADATGAAPAAVVYPIAVALLPLGWWLEKRQADPLLPRPLLGDRRLLSAALVLVAGEALASCVVTFLPLFTALLFASPELGARVLLPAVLGRTVGSMACGRLVARWSVQSVAALGVALTWSSSAALALLPFGGLSFAELGAIVFALGCGLGLVYTPVLVAVQVTVERRDLGSATAFENFLSAVSGVLVVGAMSGGITRLLGWREGEPLAAAAAGPLSGGQTTAFFFFWAVVIALASLAIGFLVAGRRLLGAAQTEGGTT